MAGADRLADTSLMRMIAPPEDLPTLIFVKKKRQERRREAGVATLILGLELADQPLGALDGPSGRVRRRGGTLDTEAVAASLAPAADAAARP